MNKKLQLKLFVLIPLLLSGVSCIDDNYRINEIDTSVHLAPNGVVIPLSSIERKTLEEMLGEVDMLETDDDGYYAMRNKQSYAFSMDGIEMENISELNCEMDDVQVDFKDNGEPPAGDGSVSRPVYSTAEIHEDIDIPESVKAVKKVSVRDVSDPSKYVRVRLILDIQNSQTETFYLDDLTLELPSSFIVEDNPKIDQNNIYRDDNVAVVNSSGNSYFNTVVAEFYITDIKDIPVEAESKTATLSGMVIMTASARCTDPSGINPQAEEMLISPLFVVDSAQAITFEGWLDLALEDYMDEEIESIDMSSIFDAIGEGEHRFDLAPPVITLAVTNPIDVPFIADLALDPLNGSGESFGKVTASGLKIAGTAGEPQTTHMYITDNATETAPAGYTPYNVPISQLVDMLPHTIEVGVSGVTDYSYDHKIVFGDEKYDFSIEVDVDMPLIFGENMDLVFEQNVEDVGDTFTELAEQNIKAADITIYADITTTLPLKMNDMSMEFFDASGERIPGLEITVTGVVEGPGPRDSNATSSTVSISIAIPEGGDFQALVNVDAIKLRIPIGSTGAGSRLNKNDYVEGNLRLELAKGIEIDLGKL